MFHAALQGDREAVGRLVRLGVNVEALSLGGKTALQLAASWGHCGVATELLCGRADVDMRSESPWANGVGEGWLAECLPKFERRGNGSVGGRTALMEASKYPSARMVSILVGAKADVDARDDDENTAMHLATQEDNRTMVLALLGVHADADAVNAAGRTALLLAVSHGSCREIVEALVTASTDSLDACDEDGITALRACAQEGDSRMVSVLLAAGATCDDADSAGRTALFKACAHHCLEAAEILLEAGADPNVQIGDGATVLMAAATRPGGGDVVATLIEAGANVEATNAVGESALAVACRCGDVGVVTALLDEIEASYCAHEQLRWTDRRNGWTLLMKAAQESAAIVAALLAAGADIAPTNPSGDTALMVACMCGSFECAVVLLRAGATACNRAGDSVLCVAARMDNQELASALLATDLVDVDATNLAGSTALMVACKHRRHEMMRVLVAGGANVNAVDKVRRVCARAVASAGGSGSAYGCATCLSSLPPARARGPSPAAIPKDDNTVLMKAARAGAGPDTIADLVHSGAEVDATNSVRPHCGGSPAVRTCEDMRPAKWAA